MAQKTLDFTETTLNESGDWVGIQRAGSPTSDLRVDLAAKLAVLQAAIDTIETTLDEFDLTGDLINADITAAAHAPAGGSRYKYSNSSGVVIVLSSALVEPGLCQVEKLTGAGTIRIIQDAGKTINRSSRVDSTSEVSDAVFQNSADEDTEIASSGANLPSLSEGDLIVVRNHATTGNNGLYIVTGTPTTSLVALTKVIGSDPADATSEAVDIDVLDPVTLKTRSTIWVDGNDFTVQGGTDEDEDHGGANITNFGRMVGLVEVFTGHIETADDKAYFLDQAAAYPYKVVSLTTDCESGSCSAAIEINGTAVTGISAHSVSSTEATSSASAANTVAAGDTVELVLSSNSDCLDLRFTLKIERT